MQIYILCLIETNNKQYFQMQKARKYFLKRRRLPNASSFVITSELKTH